MARLVYSAIASLDGYVADEHGGFAWAEPDEEVHAHVNDLTRPIGTYLLGRRMYDVLRAWETLETGPDQPATLRDFAQLWRGADKVVYSRTLEHASTARTTLERDFDPDAVRQLKVAADQDLLVGGPELAGRAFAAGLVDQIQLYLTPVAVGGGTAALPDGVRLDLELTDLRRFDSGVAYLAYRVAGG